MTHQTVTVTGIGRYRRLTTVARLKTEMVVSGNADDAFLADLIDRATDAIERYCHRPFGRNTYSEKLPGYGSLELQLSRTPIVAVSSVLLDTEAITDYSIGDAEEGILYREDGWDWTVAGSLGLSGRQTWPSYQIPRPGQELPDFTVAYTAGYLMPDANLASSAISVDQTDNSFNSTALFPALVKAGDVITVAGFTSAANNGAFLIKGTPTTSKIVVDATLVTEALGDAVTIAFQTLPFDVERAAMVTVKDWYFSRRDNPAIVEKQVAVSRVRYSETDMAQTLGLPGEVVGLLAPWVRYA